MVGSPKDGAWESLFTIADWKACNLFPQANLLLGTFFQIQGMSCVQEKIFAGARVEGFEDDTVQERDLFGGSSLRGGSC